VDAVKEILVPLSWQVMRKIMFETGTAALYQAVGTVALRFQIALICVDLVVLIIPSTSAFHLCTKAMHGKIPLR
jgi:hypothetical protein